MISFFFSKERGVLPSGAVYLSTFGISEGEGEYSQNQDKEIEL